MATLGQLTLISLFDRMDVKGTTSNKGRIYSTDGSPQDVLGYMLIELGYPLVPSSNMNYELSSLSIKDGCFISSYQLAADLLEITTHDLQNIWCEIDRSASTNNSIRNIVIETCNLQQEFGYLIK